MAKVWAQITGWYDFDHAAVLFAGPFASNEEATREQAKIEPALDMRDFSLMGWCEQFASRERVESPALPYQHDPRDFYTDYNGIYRRVE